MKICIVFLRTLQPFVALSWIGEALDLEGVTNPRQELKNLTCRKSASLVVHRFCRVPSNGLLLAICYGYEDQLNRCA